MTFSLVMLGLFLLAVVWTIVAGAVLTSCGETTWRLVATYGGFVALVVFGGMVLVAVGLGK